MNAHLIGLLLAAAAQLPVNPEVTEEARNERLQFIKQKVSQLELEGVGQKRLTLKDDAILRYSIPERDNGTWDGATFLWLDGVRPLAAIAVGMRRPNNAVFREITSLSGTRLICRRSGDVIWSSPSGGFLNRAFADAPQPAATEAGRLTQMRTLARRFSATCVRRGDATELRLMPQPLYRFHDEKQGILDGGLFGLAVGNDAEMLLLLEATNDSTAGKANWRFSLARMSSLELTVRLDDDEIWSIPRFYSLPPDERKTGPYVEAQEGTFKSRLEAQP